MKQVRLIIFRPVSVIVTLVLAAGLLFGQQPPARAQVLLAQGAADCFAIGQQVAAQQGGTLAGARAESRGGQTVCRIVVLVPARDGERPRRMEVTVPAR